MNEWQRQTYLRPCVFADEVPRNASLEQVDIGPGVIARVMLNVGIGYE